MTIGLSPAHDQRVPWPAPGSGLLGTSVKTIIGIRECCKSAADTVAFRKKDVDLAAALEKTVAGQRRVASDKGLSLIFKSDVIAPATINCGPDKLMQYVFRNLIDNPIKDTQLAASPWSLQRSRPPLLPRYPTLASAFRPRT